jgi:hypothetical protein
LIVRRRFAACTSVPFLSCRFWICKNLHDHTAGFHAGGIVVAKAPPKKVAGAV